MKFDTECPVKIVMLGAGGTGGHIAPHIYRLLLHGFTMNPKEGKALDISAHLSWHLSMMAGQLMPDAGIYYVPARQAVISEVLDQQILSSVSSYALSVVRFYAGDDDV